jgi:UDP-N-acetylmuramoyl-L-alanyl-D-glutamate--2,6-diaminopimelate ligase
MKKKQSYRFEDIMNILNLDVIYTGQESKFSVTSVTNNSAKVNSDAVFFAIKGYKSDGHKYINSAFEAGASVCFVEDISFVKDIYINKTIIVKDSRLAYSRFCRVFYQYPDRDLTIIGVTGTNGKTTTTYMIRSILMEAKKKVGLIGTIQNIINSELVKTNLTTPDSEEFYRLLAEMKTQGVNVVVCELSSHALALDRVDGLALDIAIYTNITRDHFDFHKSLEEYFNAKMKIFDLLDKSDKTHKCAVINRDDQLFNLVLPRIANRSFDCFTTGLTKESDYHAPNTQAEAKILSLNSFTCDLPYGRQISITTQMLGSFNVYNCLAAIAATDFLSTPVDNIRDGLAKITVKGRFEVIPLHNGGIAIVDYAHTDDALTNVLNAICEFKINRLITVFGCGGNRDKEKRPLMGEAVARLSDVIIVTSDNPRNENPVKIIEDIIPGILKYKSDYFSITDRKEAIYFALKTMGQNDILLIAGKGHEDYQIIGSETNYFSDQAVVLEYLKG